MENRITKTYVQFYRTTKWILVLGSIFFFVSESSFAQNLDVQGDALITGQLNTGQFSIPGDNFITTRTVGGNQFSSGIKLRHFNEDYGYTIESDEADEFGTLQIKEHLNNNAGNIIFLANHFGNFALGGATIANGYRLSVNGKVAAEEVLVDLMGDWPDYVFMPNYPLRTLNEVKHHIDSKGHLPGVPSAVEVEQNGIQLGEMNKILMEKIEELTLYILQQEERISALENKAH